jgi:DNA gyrase inhibitor GyrI
MLIILGYNHVVAEDWIEDFSSFNPALYHVEGSAYWDKEDEIFVVTPSGGDQKGRIYFKVPFFINQFRAEFDIKMQVDTTSGADGMTFAFVRDFTYSSYGWHDMDFSGADGYAIEFDNWGNGYWEPEYNHIGVIKDYTTTQLVAVREDNLEDGQWHHVVVEFNQGHVIVLFDEEEKIDYTIQNFVPFNGYFGFTAATGPYEYNWFLIDNVMIKEKGTITVDTIVNQNNFEPGDTITIGVQVDNIGSTTTVDARVCVKTPTGDYIRLRKHNDISIREGIIGPINIVTYTFTQDDIEGTYEAISRLLHPDSGETISKDIEVFTFTKP